MTKTDRPPARQTPWSSLKDQLHTSHVVKKLAPGRHGTLRAMKAHGATLVCVRYRHDTLRMLRFTTVELVIDTAPIHRRRFELATFGILVAPHETRLNTAMKESGARWDGRQRLWWARGATICRFGLLDRIRAF
jgi:hypothetical protein